MWLAPRYYRPERDALVLSMHAWVVKTGRHTVLIDTCIGNDKERMPRAHRHRMRTPFLERLRAAGNAPEDVDYVMCRHLHADHIGWNTVLKDGRWVPTFPKARYLFARIEYEHWLKNRWLDD
jgi:glyoxylase-like metal-dependent hydrolase (beta-lactamase superfamily II)